jgi:hypothetical protein
VTTRRQTFRGQSIVDAVLRTWTGVQSFLGNFRVSDRSGRNGVSKKLQLEELESRISPATDTFINPAGGSWSTASNWSLGRSPINGDDVDIPTLPGNAPVTLVFSATINSLTLNGTLITSGFSSLAVETGAVQGTGTLDLAGGSLIGATVPQSITIVPDGGDLSGVTLEGNRTIAGGDHGDGLVIANGLTINGTVQFGDGNPSDELLFIGSQTLGGNGALVLGANSSLVPDFLLTRSTLTIGQGLTVSAEHSNIISTYGSVINGGTVYVGQSSNVGFSVVGLSLGGNLSVTTTGHLFLVGSATADISGSLDNEGTLTLGGNESVIAGSYIQGSSGVLNVQIGNPPAMNQSPRIHSSNGPPGLSGNLTATYVNGYSPSPGEQYWIIGSSALTGTFSSVVGGTAAYFGGDVFLNTAATAEITPTSLVWNATTGGVDFGYQVSSAAVPTSTKVALYWSTTNQVSGAIGGPVYTQDIPAGTAIGSYGPFNVPVSELGTPPQGANYLLAVTDPNNVLGNFDPAKNVTALTYERATQLVMPTATQPPAIVGINHPFKVQALAEDSNGNLDQFFNGSVTIQLASGPSGATLGGTVTVTAVNGVATFSDLTLKLASSKYTLQATSNGLGMATTNMFTVAYTPSQIRTAYGINNLLDGTGQTIAIVNYDDDPNIFQEVDGFDNQFGITYSGPTLYQQYGSAESFLTILNQNGEATPLPVTTDTSGEEALDVEWAHAIAPGARIIFVECVAGTDTPSLLDNLMTGVESAEGQPGVSVVSMSWGFLENSQVSQTGEQSYDKDFNMPGVTFLAATGDQGNLDASYPAFSPNVVALGGTTLTLDNQGNYINESGWSGSGGGVSLYEDQPAYQDEVQKSGKRTIPDVSFDANPASGAAVYFGNSGATSWHAIGGTSLATPCWAGLIALVNQGRKDEEKATLDSSSPTDALDALYSMPTTDFHANLDGNNGTNNLSSTLLNSTRYDYVTGLGSPIANSLVPDLIAWNPVSLSPSSLSASTVGVAYSQAITASGGTGSPPLVYTITSGAIPAGLTFFAQNNQLLITGTPTDSDSVSFSVTATDAVGSTATQQYTLTINPAVTLSPDSLPASTVGVGYNQVIIASDGTGNKTVTYTVTGGVIPSGLSFTSSNNQLAIVGTPTASGTVSFDITATDSVGATATQSYTLTINPAVNLNPGFVSAGIVGAVYVQTITANGGTGNKTVTYSVTAGSIPSGLIFTTTNSQLEIIGTPTASSAVSFSVTAADTVGAIASQQYTLTINPDSTTTSLTASANPSVYGQLVTLTATVGAAPPGSGTPTGTVTFYDGSTILGIATLVHVHGFDQATFSTSALSIAMHSITAIYSGDSNYLPSTSAALSQTINALTSSNLQNVLAQSIQSGNPVTIEADPTQPASLATIFSAVNGLQSPGAPITLTVDLEGGTYTDQTVSPPTDVTLVIQNGTLVGASPALTVTGGLLELLSCTLRTATDAPTILLTGGSLSLLGDTVQESTSFTDAAIAVTGGTLDLGTAASPGGNMLNINGTGEFVHNITGNFIPAVGDTFEDNGTVLTASSLSFTTLATTTATSVFGQSVTITATVTPDLPGSAPPTGNVDFYDTTTGTDLGSVPLSSGSASLTIWALPTGIHYIRATYSGDSNYTLSLDALTQTVNKAPTATGTVTSLASPLFGVDSVTFTATISVPPPGSGSPSGSVDFVDTTTGQDLGSFPLVNGVASLSTGSLAVGNHTITATYRGDGNFLSSSGPASLVVIPPASLSGLVFEDFNDDGQVDFGENGIAGVIITLAGTDDLGNTVSRTQTTDANGVYAFGNLRPGSYTITETQPAGYNQGIDTVGTWSGAALGTVSAVGQFSVSFSSTRYPINGTSGINYNFGERPVATGPVQAGQTAGIGFWHNKNGQALILALNGGTGTQLGDWLAATLPNMYGKNAAGDDLAGKSNAYIASFFHGLFAMQGPKLDAQVLATALSVYVTNATLDNTGVGEQYGFTVSGNGVGTATVNVGSNGDAFGVANNTTLTVMDLLLATNNLAVNGLLYNGNTGQRREANFVYSTLNDAGGIN